MTISHVDMKLYVRIDAWEKMSKNRKQYPPQGGMSTVYASTCRVGKGEQGEPSPAIRARTGRPHLDLRRFRLDTLSKSDFSIAGTTWASLSSHVIIDCQQNRLRTTHPRAVISFSIQHAFVSAPSTR